jgi:hypothetical protein
LLRLLRDFFFLRRKTNFFGFFAGGGVKSESTEVTDERRDFAVEKSELLDFVDFELELGETGEGYGMPGRGGGVVVRFF